MNLRFHLRRLIDHLSRLPFFAWCFGWIYRAQLTIILAVLSAGDGLDAILVRRGLVLEHRFPGESDFDVTCVVRPGPGLATTVPRLGRRFQRLRRLLPSLGELHVIPGNLLAALLARCGVIYDPPPCGAVVRASHSWSPPTAVRREPLYALQRVAADALFHQFHLLFRGDRPADAPTLSARGFLKHAVKQERYLSIYRTGENVPLDYRDTIVTRMESVLPRATLLSLADKVMDLPAAPLRAEDRVEDLNVLLAGSRSFDDATFPFNLREALSSLIDEHRRWIKKAWLTRYRPGNNSKIVLLETDAGWHRDAAFVTALRDVGERLPRFDPTVMKSPVPLVANQWSFVMAADPLLRGISDAYRRDLITGDDHRGPETFRTNRRFVEIEIIQTVLILFSCVRANDSFALLNLLFGQLIPYRELLESGTLPLSLQHVSPERIGKLNLTPAQRGIARNYEDGDVAGINRIDARKLWAEFSNVIVEESARSVALLQNSSSAK